MPHVKTFAIAVVASFVAIAVINRVAFLKSIAYPTAA
jgi:hypothetical protein